MAGLRLWRFHHFGNSQFCALLTRWFYFTNHSYRGEHKYWVRVGEWRKAFGPRR